MLGIVLAPYGKVPGAFPYEVGYSYGGDGTFMCPDDDKQYQQRGEMGHYYDTPLGAPLVEYSPMSIIAATIGTLLPKAQANQGLVSKLRNRYASARASGSCAPGCWPVRGGGCDCPETGPMVAAGPMVVNKQLGSSIPGDQDLYQTYGFIPQMSGWVASKSGPVQTPWLPPNGWRPSPLRGLGDVSPDASALLKTMSDQNSKMFTLSVITTIAVGVSAVVAIVRNSKAIKNAIL